jgi:hypothetical protein
MTHSRLVGAVVGACAACTLAPAVAFAQSTPASPLVDITTLKILRDKSVITQVEYETALHDIGASTGSGHAAEANTLVVGKWATTIYGFVEGDTIYDTTESFNDVAGGAQVARPSGQPAPPPAPQVTYAGNHGRFQMSVRNSRLGFRLRAPGTETVHTSAMLELDLLGNQPPGITESSFFTSPAMRVRHAMLRVETPIVDVLAGQYWHLFGWQNVYHPNTVEIQGVPGELYARTPQVRVSKTFKGEALTLEVALAVMRPPARDSQVPEGEGGVRLAVNKWTGLHTGGATATGVMPLSIAVTGDYRHFEVPEADTIVPGAAIATDTGSVAADAFIPVIPATEDKRSNALSIVGEFVYGNAIQDLYTGMTSGVEFPFIPNNTTMNPSPTWPQNIDNGLVAYDISPGSFALHPIQWTSLIVGLEYYLPGLDGRAWISGNYSRMQSANSKDFARAPTDAPNPMNYYFVTSTGQVRKSEDWADVNFFFDPTASVRVGLEGAAFFDHYVDGVTGTNYRAQVSGWFIF